VEFGATRIDQSAMVWANHYYLVQTVTSLLTLRWRKRSRTVSARHCALGDAQQGIHRRACVAGRLPRSLYVENLRSIIRPRISQSPRVAHPQAKELHMAQQLVGMLKGEFIRRSLKIDIASASWNVIERRQRPRTKTACRENKTQDYVARQRTRQEPEVL